MAKKVLALTVWQTKLKWNLELKRAAIWRIYLISG